MSEPRDGDWQGPERRRGDRRRGKDRRRERRGIRTVFPFAPFLDRRSGKDRRSGEDRRRD